MQILPRERISKLEIQEFMIKILKSFLISKEVIFIMVITLIIAFSTVPVITYLYFAKDLQSPEGIMNKNNSGVVLLDRKGRPFFSFYQGKINSSVAIGDLKPFVSQAIIAAEDKDFYNHPGFSPKAYAAAFIADVKNKDFKYGGSTITQQLAKNSLLSSKKSLLRKYQELVLAQEIERRYSKDEILEMYLNSAYFGEGAFGVDEAAKAYFNKSAKDLDLAESTLLAGLLPAPSTLSPISGDFEKAKIRQSYVLSQMAEQGYINEEEKIKAENKDLAIIKPENNINKLTAHFALLVKQELIDKYGEETISRSGFKVYTSLDLDFQKYTDSTVKDHIEKLQPNRVTNGAAVLIDPKTGEILALVGSKDWDDEDFGRVNIVTTPRSPGSSFKPLVYALGFEEKIITPASILNDSPITFKEKNINGVTVYETSTQNTTGPKVKLASNNSPVISEYTPKDYDRKFRGPVTVRRALDNSLNIPSVELMSKIGVPGVLDFAQKMGITTLKTPSDYGLSLVLGTAEVKLLDLTNAYATFANQGNYNNPTTIVKIEDKTANTIYSHTPEPKQVISPESSYLITSILTDQQTRREAFGNALDTKIKTAIKTGTAEDYKDALTLGYTPNLAIGVWVGNNDNSSMDNIAGSLGAAPIFKTLMEELSPKLGNADFVIPAGITTLSICKNNGLVLKTSQATSSAFQEYFIQGTQPTRLCNLNPSPPPTNRPYSSPGNSSFPVSQPTSTPTTRKIEEDGQTTIIQQTDGGQVKITVQSGKSKKD